MFSKFLLECVGPVRDGWDTELAGVSRPDQAAAEHRQEEQAGLKRFDPDALVGVLRDSKFYHYLCMSRGIETIPLKLAAYGEFCPCHAPLLGNLSNYQREQLMSKFYGQHVTNCPAAGMMAPELVAGSLVVKSLA
jgi:hypothetical protein